MNESDYRAVLAERIKASRRRRFKTVDAARQAADISRGTWEKAEKGLKIKDFSLAAIEKALEWPEGYALAILEGTDPGRSGLAGALGVSEEPRARPALGGLDAYLASIEDRLDDLESRMAIMENPYLAELNTADRYNKARVEAQRHRRRIAEQRALEPGSADDQETSSRQQARRVLAEEFPPDPPAPDVGSRGGKGA